MILVIGMVEIFLTIVFNAPMNMSFFSVFLATNTEEAREFLEFYLTMPKVFMPLLYFTFGSVLFFIIFAIIVKYIKKYTIKNTQDDSKVSKFIALTLCLIGLIWIFSHKDSGWLNERNKIFTWQQTIEETLRLNEAYTNQATRMDSALQKHLQNERVTLSKRTQEKPINVVVIIGESTQRNYMSLYGYPLPSTPHLETLAKSENLITFSDVIAPHSHTDLVLPKLLTFSHYENASTPWFENQNLFDVLHLAGYKTHWLSNQESFSIWGSTTQNLYSRAQNIVFTEHKDNYDSGRKLDEALLPLIDSTLEQNLAQNKQDKNVYFIHLMGTHGGYNKRYPKSYEQFDIEILKKQNLHTLAPYPQNSNIELNDSQISTKAHYLNAILYNDFVLSEIFKRFNDENTLVLYLSDHGDEVYDCRDFVGHTESMGSRFMVEIPFMAYVNDGFKRAHSDIVARLESAKDKPFMSDDFIHSLLDLLGISSKDFVESRSLFSPHFNNKRERIFSGKNYDIDLKDKSMDSISSRLWLHRVDELKKLEDFRDKYQGFEIDVHFLGYFDVGHDGEKSSIGLNLSQMLAQLPKNFYTDSKKLDSDSSGVESSLKSHPETQTPLRLWLDFKNLSTENKNAALKELLHLVKIHNLKPANFIIESSHHAALDIFKQAGFFTSYYVPYYEPKDLQSRAEEIREQIRAIIKSGNVNALSFPYYLYDFMVQSHFQIEQNGEMLDMPLLTWNEGANWQKNMQTPAYLNPQIKVILVGEKGAYR